MSDFSFVMSLCDGWIHTDRNDLSVWYEEYLPGTILLLWCRFRYAGSAGFHVRNGLYTFYVYDGYFSDGGGSPISGGYVKSGVMSVNAVFTGSNPRIVVAGYNAGGGLACSGQSASLSYIIPINTLPPAPQPPSFANNTNNLCSGEQVTISTSAGTSVYAYQYYWEISTDGGASYNYLSPQPTGSSFTYTAPTVSGTSATVVSFKVWTRFTQCSNLSAWAVSGSLYVNPPPPAFTVGTPSPKICNDPGSVSINITSDNSSTAYFFGYQTSTGEDGSTPLTGNGAHSIPIPFTTPAGNTPVTVTFRLRYIVNGAEAPSVCASADKQVTLSDNSYKLSLTAVGTQESCHNSNNGSVNLTVNNGTGPYTYQWTGGRTTEDITGLGGGQRYKVAVYDKHGCTDTTSAFVKNPPVVKVDNAYVTSDHNGFGVSCNLSDAGGTMNDGTLQVDASGGTGTLSYRLQGGTYSKGLQPSQIFTGLYPDTYTVYISDANGCGASGTQPVVVSSPAAITYSSLDTTRLTCAGVPDGMITVTGAGGGYGTYQYMVNGGVFQRDNVIRALAANTYTVTIRDDNGCTQTGTAVIKQPAPLTFSTISSTPQSCAEITDGTITLAKATGGTGTRTYSLNDINYVAETSGILFSNLAAGNYTIYVKDAKQCKVSKSYLVGARPVLSVTFGVGTPISCYGKQDGAINMTPGGGTAPYTFLWSTNATTEDIANVGDGSYTVTLHDSKGCERILVMILKNRACLRYSLR